MIGNVSVVITCNMIFCTYILLSSFAAYDHSWAQVQVCSVQYSMTMIINSNAEKSMYVGTWTNLLNVASFFFFFFFF